MSTYDDYDRFGPEAAALLRKKDREARRALSDRELADRFDAQGWDAKIAAAEGEEEYKRVLDQMREAALELQYGADGVEALKASGHLRQQQQSPVI